MKKNSWIKTVCFCAITALPMPEGISAPAVKSFSAGEWTLSIDRKDGAATLSKNGNELLVDSRIVWGLDSTRRDLSGSQSVTVSAQPFSDAFGEGTKVTVKGRRGSERIEHRFYLYPSRDYILTDFTVSDPQGVELNYMAPVSSLSAAKTFTRCGNNILFVPYDNDAWVRYRITPFDATAPESYEVSALFNSDTRQGLVAGSIEHDVWKTGIKAHGEGVLVDTLTVYGGAWSPLTRDVRPHGAVKGTTVKSPKIMVGLFDDWRDGMETYADLCAAVAPRIASKGERPFGWNSWGKLQTKINFDNASQVSRFFNDNLENRNFIGSDSTVYIGLDAFWDFGLNEQQRREFTTLCHSRGQKAGIYYCPFTDWAKNPDAIVAEAPQYKMNDLYLKHDGNVLVFDGAYALDPTHPGTKARIVRQINQFIEWGYGFMKIDFMAHGAYESDSHYDPSVHTGVQAYNQGMAFIDSVAGGKLWINLSIAPLFPANYAHSRRIGCDAWADIGNTEYTLNALTYGWWLDRVYHYNDADHIVMEGVSDGENRARLTSSAITGLFFLGDNLSESGNPDTRERVLRTATNPRINEMARRCKSFRPVEHGTGDRAADMFYYRTGDALYLAVFNFGEHSACKRLPLRRLGLSESRDYDLTELWSSDKMKACHILETEIPAKDVKIFLFNLSHE